MGIVAVWIWGQQFQSPFFMGTQPPYATKALTTHLWRGVSGVVARAKVIYTLHGPKSPVLLSPCFPVSKLDNFFFYSSERKKNTRIKTEDTGRKSPVLKCRENKKPYILLIDFCHGCKGEPTRILCSECTCSNFGAHCVLSPQNLTCRCEFRQISCLLPKLKINYILENRHKFKAFIVVIQREDF